jgi:hypothetical protein
MWDPQHLTTLQASTACYRDRFIFLLSGNMLPPSPPLFHPEDGGFLQNIDSPSIRLHNVRSQKTVSSTLPNVCP